MADDDRTWDEYFESVDIEPAGGEQPEQVGPYRILQPIGEGGMGVVYMAEQQEPVRRTVALKLIKAGMDTKQVVARFESERQALALMNHPNIAQVLDAGATDRGLPFFAMEYVKGVAITTYCDREKLSTLLRIELFLQVCDGLQHAHQKGIIHRDIKPSNVLVQDVDDRPVPKLIDFGVAKATTQKLTERTMFTQVGAVIGTPEYMSPEQVEMGGVDIDTRSDVYSLGVLLYELLAGALPFDAAELRSVSFDELRHKIRDVDPPRPSTRLTTLADDSAEPAGTRGGDTATVARQLRGDLDWIIMKALEKDRKRRYGSPQELADDLRRHLNDEPVLATPPTTAYRLSKWVRRHKVAAVAGSLLTIAVLGGLAGTSYGLVRATRAEAVARNDATTAEQVSRFMVDLFRVSNPGEDRGNTVTAREILDQGAQRIRNELTDQPAVHARLMATMGDVYVNLGLYADARQLLEETLTARRKALGDDHPDVARDMNGLGVLLYRLGDAEEAATLIEGALEIQERVLPPHHPDIAATLNTLGALARRAGDRERARSLFERALEIREQSLPPDDPLVAQSLSNLASQLSDLGEHDEARRLLERSIEIRERNLGAGHTSVANALNSLANVLFAMEHYDEAQPHFERALTILEKTLEPDHPRLASVENNLGRLLKQTGDYGGARPHFERALAINEKKLGPDHRSTVINLYNLARLSALEADRSTALALLRRSAEHGLGKQIEARGFVPVGEEADLASLHGDPEFDAVLALVDSR